MVKRWLKVPETGRGPTRSTWGWLILLLGTRICETREWMWVWILLFWQDMHKRAHGPTSLNKFSRQNVERLTCKNLGLQGVDRPWSWRNKTPVERSQKTNSPKKVTSCTLSTELEIRSWVSEAEQGWHNRKTELRFIHKTYVWKQDCDWKHYYII